MLQQAMGVFRRGVDTIVRYRQQISMGLLYLTVCQAMAKSPNDFYLQLLEEMLGKTMNLGTGGSIDWAKGAHLQGPSQCFEVPATISCQGVNGLVVCRYK